VNENHKQCGSHEWRAVVRDSILPLGLGDLDLGQDVLEVGPGFVAPPSVERTASFVASDVKKGKDHGEDPFGAAGHVHVGRAGEHRQLAVWKQVGRLEGVGHGDEVVVADEYQRRALHCPQVRRLSSRRTWS
jgi:hypothetical protein